MKVDPSMKLLGFVQPKRHTARSIIWKGKNWRAGLRLARPNEIVNPDRPPKTWRWFVEIPGDLPSEPSNIVFGYAELPQAWETLQRRAAGILDPFGIARRLSKMVLAQIGPDAFA
jgi:hypothetical protein